MKNIILFSMVTVKHQDNEEIEIVVFLLSIKHKQQI